MGRFFRWARWLYAQVEAWARHRHAVPILGGVSFIEAIFFPIPPDLLLIPMAVARPGRALFYAAVCLAASLAGGLVGYWIGAAMMDVVGTPIIQAYGLEAKADRIMDWYRQYDAWIVAIAGFTPIPYKVFTLTSGAAAVNLPVFVLASLASRGARFFLVAGLIAWFGERAAAWIERNFNLLTILLMVIVIGIVWSASG